jgi:hypothetical protein
VPAAVAAGGVVAACLLLRATLRPLIGYDTYWRWDFLARQILERGTLDYYPPLTPAQFALYFWPDAIPPLVSFSYWWLYASAGERVPALTGLLLLTQYACTLALTYRTAAALFSRRAGLFAVAVLASSLLFYRAVIIGQETGLTALALIAMIYFLVSCGGAGDVRGLVLAGLCAAVAPLAREYGWAFVPLGMFVLWWRGLGVRAMLPFALTAVVAAAPWYVRTAWLTGNPLYSTRFLGLPVNPVLAAMMDSYREQLGVSHWTSARWKEMLAYLVSGSPFQVLLGLPAGVVFWRRHAYLSVAVLLVAALWLSSVGYTSGLALYASRVLSPALVVLSLLAGALLDRILSWALSAAFTLAELLVVIVIIAGAGLLLGVVYLRAVSYAVLYPMFPQSVPPGRWASRALERHEPVPDQVRFRDEVPGRLPAGSRILSDDPYSFVALVGTGYDVVPVWSPEVDFLFDRGLSASEVQARLGKLGFRAFLQSNNRANTGFLDGYAFFAEGRPGWPRLATVTHEDKTESVLYELPPAPSGTAGPGG